MIEFGPVNWAILVIYILANLLLGYVLGKRISSDQDFYLGKKTTPWWAIGVSVIATYVSALTFLGAPAWSYKEGLSVIAIHLNYPLVIFVVVTIFFPFFYNSGVASIYEYIEKRFGNKARATVSTIWMLSQTLTAGAILYATSLVLGFITGIDVVHAIIIVTLIALIYTAMGGITAVIWTDVIQSVVLLIGTIIIVVALLDNMPFTLHQTLLELKAQGKTNPLDFSFDFSNVTTVWSGVIAMTIFHIMVYGTNQMMVQRTLASKNIGDAKKSYMLMGYLAFSIYFLYIVLGILFYSHYGGREFENGNTIILQFAADYGLPGLMGIIAAAVMAASMSSMDSAFNSLSTVAVVDFYQKYFKKDGTPEHYLKVTRMMTVVFAILIIIPAILYTKSEGSVLEILSKVGSFFVGAQLGMFVLGFFFNQATEKGVLVGTAAAFLAVAYVATSTDVAWPWYCAVGIVVSIAVTLIASRLIDGAQSELSSYTIKGQKEMFREQGWDEMENGWYKVPGKIDKASYGLLIFFVAMMAFLFLFESMI